MAVIFPILSTFNAAGVNSAQRAFKGLGGVAKTATIAFGVLGAASIKFGKDAVTAAAADQKAQLKLAKTLENVTKATEVQTAAVEKFITAQQFATGVSDSELRPALETLVRATGDVTKAQGLLKLGLDVSAGSGRDLESISLALAKAQGGQFTALQRLGVVLPDNIKKSKDFAKVQEYLNKLFGGQAAVAADTYSGKLAIMRERLGEAQETIGSLLIPILTKLADVFLNKVMPAIERVVTAIQLQGAEGGLKTIGVEISNVITNLTGTAKAVKDLILVFIGIKVVIPIVLGLQASWVAVTAAIGATATATQIAAGVMKRALISTGIGALIVAAGFVVGKFIDMRIQANATDKTIRVLESNGVQAMTRFGNVAALANEKVQRNIVSLNAVQLAATRAGDALDNAGILDVKRGKIPVYNPVAVPGIADVISVGSAGTSKKAEKKAKEAAKAAEAMAKLIANSTKSATSALTKMNNKLTTARDKLKVAKDAYKSYRDGVKEAIISQFSFTSVLDTFTDRQDEAKEASQKLAEAQLRYKDALKNPKDVEKIADALKELTAAQTANANATKNKKTFLQVMRDQATAAVAFASKVKKLMVMGLSKAGLDQVIAAGADAGTAIADELIAGGASAIKETNTLLKSVESAAQVLGKATADQFFKTGVTQGEQMVAGIVSAIKKAGFIISGGQVKLPKKLQKALDSGKLSDAQVTELNTLLKGVPKLANGGVVNKPTLAMIGEAGPEAVIPLSGRNAGMGTVYNINVNAGIGTNGAQVGRDIVDAIKKYERASGPVFASA
jgi:hypothetical protein